MTPKEKAMQLFDKMIVDFSIDKWQTQQCALVAVDEIINYLTTSLDVQTSLNAVDYWREVKQEIQKL